MRTQVWPEDTMIRLCKDGTARRRLFSRVSDRSVSSRPAVNVAVSLLFLVAACGSNSSPPASGPVPSSSSASSTSGTASSSASTSGSSSSSSSGAGNAGVPAGTVGEADAYAITLTDSAGAPVTSLKAGSYTVKVKDASKIHNFHLTGAGVDQKTTVPDITEVTWTVSLQAGSYTFKCSPHPKMTGTFTVT